MQLAHELRADIVGHPLLGVEVKRAIDELAHFFAMRQFHSEKGSDDDGRHSRPKSCT